MLVLIADTHVNDGEKGAGEFLRMLQHLSTLPYDICFLGDIFELWIGVSGYEQEIADTLLCWCLAEKQHRRIFLVEGNHEFFIVGRYGSYFSIAAEGVLRYGDLCFCHGDQIPRSSTDLLLLRRLLKNPVVRLLMGYLPGAQGIVRRVKNWFYRRSLQRSYSFPRAAIVRWASQQLETGGRELFLGHFHRQESGETLSGDGRWHCLPAWKERGEIALYDPETHAYMVMPWETLR